MRLFRKREHRHHYDGEIQQHLYIGPAHVAWIATCRRCGEEVRELTQAGWQQIGWWMERGLSREDAIAKVWAGEDALGRWMPA